MSWTSIRKAFFWLHLSAAVGAGSVILLMAGTGLLLSFESQIQAWADREPCRFEAPREPGTTSLEGLLTALDDADLRVSAVTVRRSAEAPVSLALGREGVLCVDPHRGTVLGPGAAGVRKAFRGVTDLHRFLATAGESREIGKTVTGVANLVFVVILATGLVIWLPRRLGLGPLRNAAWFRRGLTGKARDFNWHHVFGIWAVVPLVLMTASALPISFAWAGDLVSRITASSSAGSGAPAGGPRSGPTPLLAELDLAGLDRALDRAKAEVPDWQSIIVRLPPRPDGTLGVTAERAARRGRPDLREQLAIDLASGELVEHARFADQDRGRRARAWMRWIHTGEAGGVAGQAVAAAACAATMFLGWTGYALAGRRFAAWRRQRAREISPPFDVPSPISDPRIET